MKRQITYFILTAGLSALLGSPAVSAQDQMEIANVPFAFQANETMLAAGKYVVSRDVTSKIIRLRSVNSGGGIFVTTHPGEEGKAESPRLRFTCYGDNCVLSTIWLSDRMGYAATQPKHGDGTRKIGLSAEIRSVRLTSR